MNGNFEQYTSCPTAAGFVNLANSWDQPIIRKYKDFCYSAYLNSCATTGSLAATPKNKYGTEPPHGGKGYGSFNPFMNDRDGHDEITPQLTTGHWLSGFLQGRVKPLSAGKRYYYEMYLSYAEWSTIASGYIGAVFTEKPVIAGSTNMDSTGSFMYGMKPDILGPAIHKMVTAPSGWFKISGYYRATGNENYFLIGTFKLDTMHAIFTGAEKDDDFSIYYVDDVSLIDCDSMPPRDILPNDTLICDGLPMTLNAHQPDTMVYYLWSTGSVKETIQANISGKYSVQISINGCPYSFFDTINIVYGHTPKVNLGNDTIFCLNKSVNIYSNPLTPDSPYTYRWNTGITTPTCTVNKDGMYSLTISSKGCMATDSINVSSFPLKTFSLGPDTTYCTNDSIVLDGTIPGSDRYLWSTGDTASRIKVMQSGLYWAEVFGGSCSFRDSVIITNQHILAVYLGPPFQDMCDYDSVKLDAGNPGATYLWNTGDTTRVKKVKSAGLYSVKITYKGCESEYESQINVLPTPHVELGPDTTLCEGISVTLDATTPGATYKWQDNSNKPLYAVTKQGMYKVIVSMGRCISADSVQVKYNQKPAFTLGNDQAYCFQQPVTLDASSAGAESYRWQDKSTQPFFVARESGLYWVEISKNLCMVRDSIVLSALPLPKPDLGPDSFFCKGGNYMLTPGNFAGYLWHDNSAQPVLLAHHEGAYKVTVTNLEGCTGADSVMLREQPLPEVSLGKDTGICEPDLVLDPGNKYASQLWQDGSTGRQFHVTGYGTFTVQVTDQYGCINESKITITNDCPSTVFVPNAFTANFDNINDGFMPVTNNVKTLNMKIYNRWGALIYETNELGKAWDGKSEGQLVMSGVYVYIINYTNPKDKPFILSGNVTLLR